MRKPDLSVVANGISAERLAPYQAKTSGNLPEAISIYQWNSRLAGAFWITLGHLEVLIRNAMHNQFTHWSHENFGHHDWTRELPHLLTAQATSHLATARVRASRNNEISPGRVVAELNFGFWRYLLASRYERTLWRTCLYRAFPGQGRRREIHDRLADLHELRNRIAHHEPIHNRPLARLHTDALTVAAWTCPTTHLWIDTQCTVNSILDQRP